MNRAAARFTKPNATPTAVLENVDAWASWGAALTQATKNPVANGSVLASRPHLSLPFTRALLYYPSCVHRIEDTNL
jgi:hypothetical protein